MAERKLLELLKLRETDTVTKFVAELKDNDYEKSRSAGRRMQKAATDHGVTLREYLTLSRAPVGDYNGYEITLAELGLPTRDDYDSGIVLEAAGDTFQTRPGTRVLFDEVLSDVLRWKTRQDQIERIGDIVASSRTITGVEMTKKVTMDDGDLKGYQPVAELGRVPVYSITATDSAVKMWKKGMGIRTSYEFSRRVRLDAITPYMARVTRKLERDKVAHATSILINGDGANSAAPVVAQGSLAPTGAPTNTVGQIQWQRFFLFLVERAKLGLPIDTVLMNYDSYYQWGMMFAPNNNNTTSIAEAMASVGIQVNRNPIFDQSINPVLSSTVPAGKLIGFTKEDTLEELVEANSSIEEESRDTTNQSITITKTENTGYHLVMEDSRVVYDYAN